MKFNHFISSTKTGIFVNDGLHQIILEKVLYQQYLRHRTWTINTKCEIKFLILIFLNLTDVTDSNPLFIFTVFLLYFLSNCK